MELQQQTLCQLLVGTCLNITLPFKASPVDFMDGLSGNAIKLNHWIIVVAPPLRIYIPVSGTWKSQKSEGKLELLQCASNALENRGSERKIKWNAHGPQVQNKKKDKVQNLCNEMSLHEESDVPQFYLLYSCVFFSKCTLSFQLKISHSK